MSVRPHGLGHAAAGLNGPAGQGASSSGHAATGRIPMRILVLEGTPGAVSVAAAETSEWSCRRVGSTAEAIALAQDGSFDAILLEPRPLPASCATIKTLRGTCGKNRLSLPIIVMMPHPAPSAAPLLDSGADDAVAACCPQDELIARFRAARRRAGGFATAQLRFGPLSLEPHSRRATLYDATLPVTPREFNLLEILVLRGERVITKAALFDRLYGMEDGPDEKALDVVVCRLRKKLAGAGAPNLIGTAWGTGYRLCDPNPLASRIALAALVSAAALAIPVSGHAREMPAGICEIAGLQAERALGLPPGLLLAIGRVESGRRDRASGATLAWPWSINVEGQDRIAETAPEAIGVVKTLQAQGHRSLDVGCFQINLMYHPTAFATLEDAFDPARNALYAAGFLSALHARLGTWPDAVAAYHSANADKGLPYRDRVLRQWTGGGITEVASNAGQPPASFQVWIPGAAPATAAPRSQLPKIQMPTEKIRAGLSQNNEKTMEMIDAIKTLKALATDRKGVTAVEYAVIAGVLVTAVAAAFNALGTSLTTYLGGLKL
eukprot:gene12524-12613_t